MELDTPEGSYLLKGGIFYISNEKTHIQNPAQVMALYRLSSKKNNPHNLALIIHVHGMPYPHLTSFSLKVIYSISRWMLSSCQSCENNIETNSRFEQSWPVLSWIIYNIYKIIWAIGHRSSVVLSHLSHTHLSWPCLYLMLQKPQTSCSDSVQYQVQSSAQPQHSATSMSFQ